MIKKILLVPSLAILLYANIATAVPFAVDFNSAFFTDTVTAAGSSDYNVSRFATDAAIGLSLAQDESLFIGASLFSGSSSQGDTTKTTWKTTDYGLRIIWFIDRIKQWGLGFTYNLAATGTYENAGTTEYWKGSSYKFDFGFTPVLFHKLYFGFRINYYMAQYNQSSSDNSTFVSESNSKSFVYPSIYLGFRY